MTDPIPVVDVPPKTPVSPKVILAGVWAFAAPILLLAAQAGIGYLATDDGHALFAGLPVLVQTMIYAVISGLAGALGGYLKRDRLRERGAIA